MIRRTNGHQQAGLSITNNISNPWRIGCHDRHPRGHRFDQHKAKSFCFRWQDEQIDLRQRLGRTLGWTSQNYPVAKTKFCDLPFQFGMLLTFAKNETTHAIEVAHRINQIRNMLNGIESANETDSGRSDARIFSKRDFIGIDRIRNHDDLFCWYVRPFPRNLRD